MLKDILSIDHARIINKNFAGEGSMYNRDGDRKFSIIFDDVEYAEYLRDLGWNVSIKPSKTRDDEMFCTLDVAVKYNDKFPNLNPEIYLISGRAMNFLPESEIHQLDDIAFENVDLDIRPYNWTANGKTGVKAYLVGMKVTQRRPANRFRQQYEDYQEENSHGE